ncbi:MAG: hypothetical protein M3P89_14745 [Actinomycetota bacterium]|nr:hypothetical protein [Actinomycetota bacterium]MDP9460949.1 hypothetical protein [Actinomycetota bacterium]
MLNVVEYILVFAGIPLAFVLLLAALIFLPGRKRTRYKPGQPWDHAPVWYEPHPEHGPAAGGHGAPGLGNPGHDGQTQAIGSSIYGEATGSSHDASGSSGHKAIAPRAVPAGPLGGARGTW